MDEYELNLRLETLKAIIEMAFNMFNEEQKKEFERRLAELEEKMQNKRKEKGYIS